MGTILKALGSGLFVFVLVAGGLLFQKGYLNPETIQRLRGGKTNSLAITELKAPPTPVTIAEKMAARETELEAREAEIEEEWKRLQMERKDLESLQRDAQETLDQVTAQFEALTQEQDAQLSDWVKTYEEMKEQEAAAQLGKLELEDQLKILSRMSAKARAKVLEKMGTTADDAERVAAILKELLRQTG